MLNDFRDRLVRLRLQKDEKFVSFIFSIEGLIIIFLIANIIYLNIYIFNNLSKEKPSENKSGLLTNSTSSPSSTIFPTPCIDCSNQNASTTITQPKQLSTAPIQNTVKDYFIPLGSGTNQTSDWTDVPGVQTMIDFNQYQNIKEIHFEASIYVPTANESVSVRLYNVTDNHPVWYSDVTMNGNSSAYLTSPAIIYDTGSKWYQVQMKTQLQALATLVQSKIHITLK